MAQDRDERSPIRLLIADDSATVRAILRAAFTPGGDIAVIGEAADGMQAVLLAERLRPDAILMDIRMPVMDGIQATERIMAGCAVPIVAFSSLTWGSESRSSIAMLAAGALDVMAKPELGDEASLAECLRQLRTKIRVASGVSVVRHLRGRARAEEPSFAVPGPCARGGRYGALGIGASTGGPAALRDLLRRLPSPFPLPILVVQHITPGFASGLVEWLRPATGLDVRLARERDRATPGAVLLAPEGRQMEAFVDGSVSALSRTPRGVHLPSADVLFSSLARAFGGAAIGIIMTGMGDDGVEGLAEIRRAGGVTIAQDEASCVVYGMPGEALRRKAAQMALSPEGMATYLGSLLAPSRSGEYHV